MAKADSIGNVVYICIHNTRYYVIFNDSWISLMVRVSMYVGQGKCKNWISLWHDVCVQTASININSVGMLFRLMKLPTFVRTKLSWNGILNWGEKRFCFIFVQRELSETVIRNSRSFYNFKKCDVISVYIDIYIVHACVSRRGSSEG